MSFIYYLALGAMAFINVYIVCALWRLVTKVRAPILHQLIVAALPTVRFVLWMEYGSPSGGVGGELGPQLYGPLSGFTLVYLVGWTAWRKWRERRATRRAFAATDEGQREEVFRKARRLKAKGYVHEAREAFEQVVERWPDTAEAEDAEVALRGLKAELAEERPTGVAE